MRITRTAGSAVLAGSLVLTGAVMTPAEAQTKQDGLVNISVGDVTVLEDVNIAAADLVDAAVLLCGVDVDVTAVVLAAAAVDNRSRNVTICRNENNDKVKITQN